MPEEEAQVHEITPREYGLSIIEYYLKEMAKFKTEKIKRLAVSELPEVDPDYAQTMVSGVIDRSLMDMAKKMNYILLILIDAICCGHFEKVKEFETLLVDLLERKILDPIEKELKEKG